MKHLTPTDPVPAHGSVVLANGPSGTAYQRFFSTGLFHSAHRPDGITYGMLHAVNGGRGLLLIHDADQYEDPR